MKRAYSESDNSDIIIPSSNFEPPPPIDYVLSKDQNSRILTGEPLSQKLCGSACQPTSVTSTQQEDSTSLESFSGELSFQTAQSSFMRNSLLDRHNFASLANSDKLPENGENINPKISSPMSSVNIPSFTLRASVPGTLSEHTKRSSVIFKSIENTKPISCSVDSLTSVSIGAATSNTPSSRTTHSGSDLFKSDSSSFSKPLIPSRNWRTTVSTSTTTDDQESLPVFSYTLSLSVLRHSSRVEKSEHVEFKIPDFTKTVTWQSQVKRRDENSAAAVAEAARVLADSLGDWLRELMTSDSEEPHSEFIKTPATVIDKGEIALNARVSSSSSEYFVPRKANGFQKILRTVNQNPLENTNEALSNSSEQIPDPNPVFPELEPKVIATKLSISSEDIKSPEILKSPISSTMQNKPNIFSGMFIYAKWNSNSFFYPGQIIGSSAEDRFRILFDDKSKVTVMGRNVIMTELLPVGANVSADITCKDEYESGFLVLGHVVGTCPPSYIVKRIVDDEVYQLERRRVAIHLSQVNCLLLSGQISTISNRTDTSLVSSASPPSTLPSPSPTTSKRASARSRLLKASILDESAVTSTRRKRALTEVGRTVEHGGPTRRVIRRKTGPQHQRKGDSSVTRDRTGALRQQRTKSTPKVRSHEQRYKRKHNGLNRRESQMWSIGRRIVAQASRASKRFSNASRDRNSASFRSLRTTEASPSPPSVKQESFSPILANEIGSPTLAPTVEEQEKSPIIAHSLAESDVVGKDKSVSSAESDEFKRICRKCGIPLPPPDLFSHWCIVHTTGAKSKNSGKIRIASNDPQVIKQISICENAHFLRLLVTAGGGQDLEIMEANCVSPTGRLVTLGGVDTLPKLSDLRIAVVATSAKRTVKFLQGLATLGRVPLVHPVWLIDACLLAAGKKPLVTAAEIFSEITQNIEPVDIPLELLRRSDRSVYELPRGVDRITNLTILPHIVPALFIEPVVTQLETLTSLGGYASAGLVAIVTDDYRGFGEGWLSILRHAMYTEKETLAAELPCIIRCAESVDRLSNWLTTRGASNRNPKIVLVDQERIPQHIVPQIESMGFAVINQEFLTQSLIHGKLLDLKYGTMWKV